jgi:hypothetical protein
VDRSKLIRLGCVHTRSGTVRPSTAVAVASCTGGTGLTSNHDDFTWHRGMVDFAEVGKHRVMGVGVPAAYIDVPGLFSVRRARPRLAYLPAMAGAGDIRGWILGCAQARVDSSSATRDSTRVLMSSRIGRTESTPLPAGSSEPIAVADTRERRAGVAAAHGDHDAGGFHGVVSEDLRGLIGDVDAEFGHRLHCG